MRRIVTKEIGKERSLPADENPDDVSHNLSANTQYKLQTTLMLPELSTPYRVYLFNFTTPPKKSVARGEAHFKYPLFGYDE